MDLGHFSVSLAVSDLAASRDFYRKLGYAEKGGDAAQGWLILQNATSTIGLFQGMFDRNILTFNPGWDRNAQAVPGAEDIRSLAATLREAGIALSNETGLDAASGPASFIVTDLDGNPILIDQHL
jgi:lactoylglutathione lyase